MLADELQPTTPPFIAPQSAGSAETLLVKPLAGDAAASRKASLLATVACVGKGGSGKSTTSTNLAVIARMAGLRVAIIDADPQQSSFVWKCVRGRNDIPVCRCGPEGLNDAIEAARRAGIEILFVDMPPDLRHVPSAARHADLVLIPMRPTLFDLKVTRGLIPLLASAGVSYAVVLNAAPPIRDLGESPMVRQAREALADIGPRLWRRQITHRVTVPYAAVRGAGVVETEPAGHAACEFRSLWNAVRNTLKLEGPVHEIA
ncbi:ParA family protein [Bradyrhizobium sp. Ash2021]|uniref:ParA family protein n=1 Tax=Bradyrhizobium sp. Ash2021 TaxID=2954771 RepID=UPI00281620EF|nr:ParA family protein [Bradyrhizobium sp. Ash2021]WMT73463.1 ParA family protein [Bradyrhizobium sp. Ash2021]